MQLVIIKRRVAQTVPIHTPSALNEKPGRVGANGTVYWGDDWQPEATINVLTDRELKALRDKHKSANINTTRAIAVKNCMKDGMSCAEIVLALKSKYGERMIKADHSALNRIK